MRRVPVVDTRGKALMPRTPAKARHLFKSGKARPRRNKLGLFYVRLCYEQEPDNQPLMAGIDPGSKFEGYSVVGTKETVINLMVEAPDHVKEAVETRRTMRRARRFRKWRRPKRFDNRLGNKKRIPPSTRSRWEAKARIVRHLLSILPMTDVVVEDVQAVTRPGPGWQRTLVYPLARHGIESALSGRMADQRTARAARSQENKEQEQAIFREPCRRCLGAGGLGLRS